ncbi:MAG: glycoside hydrolase family 2 TIM barrel-domain containing protein [Gammaproteobacteria bacterium]|nr:glycoside hydrolase family 2 TIM barrel-domain containing protein [Gammaproteobacteria bacterium]
MAILNNVASVKQVSGIIAAVCLFFLASTGQAQQVDLVTTVKDANGWKLQVNGNDFYVKGVVWGYAPPGTNYTYSLWNQPEDIIKTVVDREFSLMQANNINAIRTFAIVPPEWVTYIYDNYGIMTVVNPLMGRYGASIDGVWVAQTDYSDPRTREILKEEVLAVVEEFRDVRGVLMFALGNESNYGLSWSSSFEIENLPVGEQQREKAKFLYSLFGEVIDAGKQIAPNHLFTIVNGDIQYLDLIVENGQNWDILGTNSYRGISFTDLWARVDAEYDKPVLFFEFGSDAFNSRDFREDQPAQANYLRGMWQEMYRKSYGNGEEGNAIGGFVFEWRDEWWKYKQTENLDVQDTTASWGNGGYKFDFVEGQNNMNEEWFGITRIGQLDDSGYWISEPRMALDVLAQIWSLDPYQQSASEVDQQIRDINLDYYSLLSEVRALRSAQEQSEKFRMTGGSFKAEYFIKGRDNDITVSGEDGLRFTDGQMAFLDFEFQPTSRIKGEFSLNLLANVAESDFEFRYGDRGLPYTVETLENGEFGVTRSNTNIEDNERIELYSFNATYEADDYNLEAFYHVPRYHWMYEGDFYGLLRETTDLTGANGQDIWNAKAPYGVEYEGKNALRGLKVVFGPEVYWGANPKAIAKYEFSTDNVDWAVMHAEDIAQRDDSSSATEPTERQTRQTTIYAETKPMDGMTLELGGIIASTEKVDDKYDRVEGNDIVLDEIEFEDTLGFKAKMTYDITSSIEGYVGLNYAGLVADGGATLTEWGTGLPYSDLGNKREIDGGVRIALGDYTIYPRFLYRENIVDAAPLIDPVTTGTNLSPGIDPRNRDSDPFAVLGNREAESFEVFFTYDPTPGTWFYDWDADNIEDAAFAYNIGLTATSYDTPTDSYLFFFEEGGTNAPFGTGLEAEDVWLLKSKLIFNPRLGLRIVANFDVGKQQSTGEPNQEAVEFAGANVKFVVDNKHTYLGELRIDDFGPYDFQQQFNEVYPLQAKFEYTRFLDQFGDEDLSSQWGVRALYRELDELSGADYEDGKNEYMFEVQTYFELKF